MEIWMDNESGFDVFGGGNSSFYAVRNTDFWRSQGESRVETEISCIAQKGGKSERIC